MATAVVPGPGPIDARCRELAKESGGVGQPLIFQMLKLRNKELS